MYSMKSVRPKMDPWGTPALTGYSCIRKVFALWPGLGRLWGRVSSIRCWWLSCKKLSRNFIVSSVILWQPFNLEYIVLNHWIKFSNWRWESSNPTLVYSSYWNIDVLHCSYWINEIKKTKWSINYLDKLSAWNTAIMFQLVLSIITILLL